MRPSTHGPAALLALLAVTSACAQAPAVPTSAQQVREWAAAGRSFPGAAVGSMDLAGLTCNNLDLANTNWTRTDLRGADLSGCNLTGAVMDEVVARGINFTDCKLVNVLMRRADLSGALFRGTHLLGANLSGSRLAGAQFEGALYSLTGTRHTDAIATALSALLSSGDAAPPISPTMAAGLTGDAFAFVYNSADPSATPLLPFRESPIRAAAAATGCELQPHYDLPPANAFDVMARAVKLGKVCLLPISLAGEEMSGKDFDSPFWAAATALNDVDNPPRIVLFVPPFGERQYNAQELAPRWSGPFATLEALGAERSQARCPLFVLTRPGAPRPIQSAVLAALRNAGETILDRRTYTGHAPGVTGLRRLADDLAHAAKSEDASALQPLSGWAAAPRSLLIAARTQAADFLQQAAALVRPASAPQLLAAAAMFRNESQLLADSFPSLAVDAAVPLDKARLRYAEASRIIAEIANIEAAAAETLSQVAGSAP